MLQPSTMFTNAFMYFQAEKEWHLRLYEEAIKEVRGNKGEINREVTRSRCCGMEGGVDDDKNAKSIMSETSEP